MKNRRRLEMKKASNFDEPAKILGVSAEELTTRLFQDFDKAVEKTFKILGLEESFQGEMGMDVRPTYSMNKDRSKIYDARLRTVIKKEGSRNEVSILFPLNPDLTFKI